MKLVLPSLKYQESYIEALKESEKERGETLLNRPNKGQSFKDFVKLLHDNRRGVNLPQGYVPSTMFWLIDKNEMIGRAQIRHELNDHLLKYGGHIGFYIRPLKRKMGYGTKILEMTLKRAKKLGLSKVLITCDEDNIGSQRIIEKNGGVLEKTKEKNPKMRYYWIAISSRL